MALLNDTIKKLTQFDQLHLLTFYPQLSPIEQEKLLYEINLIPFEDINTIYKQSLVPLKDSNQEDYCPPSLATWEGPEYHLKDRCSRCILTRVKEVLPLVVCMWQDNGLQAIASGKVALVILAGGQGTRLGWDKPKGTYPIGSLSGMSLFQLFCEKLLAISRYSYKYCKPEMSFNEGEHAPLYIMTSALNYNETVQFFETHHFFGLNPKLVVFCQQDLFPSLSADGKILLASKSTISQNPNGNGGVFFSLLNNQELQTMKQNGIEWVHIIGVDNPLTKVLDPILIGYTDKMEAPIGNKCVEKISPDESIGIVCQKKETHTVNNTVVEDYIPCVIEYSEMSSKMRYAKDEKNGYKSLLYSSGNICNHLFRLDFILDLVNNTATKKAYIPHIAKKKIPHIDIVTGENVTPHTNNGIKIEYFIFDCFSLANKVANLEVSRDTEFAPVKNLNGDDSPESARQLMTALYKSWCRSSKIQLIGDGMLEISPLVSHNGNKLQRRIGPSVSLPSYISLSSIDVE